MKRTAFFQLLTFLLLGGFFSACNSNTNSPEVDEALPTPPVEAGPNQLSSAEVADGWQLLFNGKDLSGWRNFNKQTIGNNWIIEEDAIHLNADAKGTDAWVDGQGGDIVFDEAFENYEFQLEWKIGACGNSGIIFLAQEGEAYDHPWRTGLEMQILDDTCHPDGKLPSHRAGSLYDLIECSEVTVKPAGEWNKIRIILKDGQLEQWQNGVKVVSTSLWTPEWKAMIANSKFKDMPGYGTFKKGKISLQDHTDPVWFKNIKIKKLG
jgi:cytochrome c